MQTVRWSKYKDVEGKLMVDVCGSHYSQELAKQIAYAILDLVDGETPNEIEGVGNVN